MEFTTFEELLIEELEDLYSAETQLVESLPKLERAVSHDGLKKAIHNHFEETKNHVVRLKKIFNILDKKIGNTKCEAMAGLLAEIDEIINMRGNAIIRDAALIGAAQKVEHYEIAGYGTAKAHAKLLELKEIVDLLEETEDEEGKADKKLTSIAEGSIFKDGVNAKAMKAGHR